MNVQRSRRQRIEPLSSPWRAIGRILVATPYTLILLPVQTAEALREAYLALRAEWHRSVLDLSAKPLAER